MRGAKKPAIPLLRYSLTLRNTTDLAHPESPTDLSLGGTAIDVQLAGDHAERLHIVDVMGEHRQVAVDIGDGRVPAYKTDVLVNQGNAFGEKRQLELRHGDCPFEEVFLIFATITKSVAVA